MITKLKHAVLVAGLGAALAAISPAEGAPFVGTLAAFGDRGFDHNGQLVQYWYPYTPYAPYPYYNGPPYPPAYYAPQPAPPPQAAPAPQTAGPPPQQFWYYCDNPKGYYPQVPNCSSAWRQVAAAPPAEKTAAPQKKP